MVRYVIKDSIGLMQSDKKIRLLVFLKIRLYPKPPILCDTDSATLLAMMHSDS